MKTIKFTDEKLFATEQHNLESINFSKQNIFGNKLNLYIPCNLNIFITNTCNNKCNFCINPPIIDTEIDDEKYFILLEKTLKELQGKGIEITITGGEPTLNKARFVETMKMCHKYGFHCRTVFTTGKNLLKKYEGKPLCQHMIENGFTHNINISRMEIDEEKNKNIFIGNNITNKDIETLSCFFKVNDAEMRISCNLLNDFTFDKMIHFVEYYRSIGVDTVMFRELIGYKGTALKDIITDENKKKFKYLTTLKGLFYDVEVFRYKGMIIKYYLEKIPNLNNVVSSMSLKNGILRIGFNEKILMEV